MFLTYLFPFLITFLLSAGFTKSVRDVAITRGWVDHPDSHRHLHSNAVPRLGGVAICLSFLVVVGAGLIFVRLATPPVHFPLKAILGIVGSAVVIFLLGLYDDLRSLGPAWKFAVQAIAAVLLCLAGLGIREIDLIFFGHTLRAAVGVPLTILWVLLITNAFNLIDGLDGLTAGAALFSTIVLLILSLVNGNYWVAFLAVVLAGAIVGFLKFNFHPATIFLGDCGSLFIGFVLSALGLAASQKAPTMIAVAIPVVSFGLPIMDVAIAVVRRFLSGRPLFRPDNEHIHHKLLKRGFSQREVVFILYGVSAVLGILSLAMLHGAGTIALVLLVLGAGIFFGVQQLRYHEFFEMGRMLERTVSQKRIITNNVIIRRMTESLHACKDVSVLCRILTETLQTLGFDGFGFRLTTAVWFPESLSSPFVQDSSGELCCNWTSLDSFGPRWELNLELVTSTGHKCGFFSLYRRQSAPPLLMDLNLLSDGFPPAVAEAVHRAVIQKYGALDDQAPRTAMAHTVSVA